MESGYPTLARPARDRSAEGMLHARGPSLARSDRVFLATCHPNSRTSSRNLPRPLRILHHATHGCFLDSNPRILYINSRAVPRGRLDRLVRFQWRIQKHSTPAHHRIGQRIASRFFDNNIDPHWSILLQPSILGYRDDHFCRCHRRALRLHGVWSTHDPECLWLNPHASSLKLSSVCPSLFVLVFRSRCFWRLA